jgi:hypothetical protein
MDFLFFFLILKGAIMTNQSNIDVPVLTVTMDRNNAKYNHQLARATDRNAIVAELLKAGVLPYAIQFRNVPVLYPIVELADLLALKLDGRQEFKAGTVEAFQNYGTAIQSLGIKGFKKASNAVTVKQNVNPANTSDNLLRASVLQAIDDRLSDIRAYYLASLAGLLDNPASWLADNAYFMEKIGQLSLESFQGTFDLPIDRINALVQREKYHAQLEQFKAEIVCNKTSNFRVHETFLVCDGQPTDEQRQALENKGYVLAAKDSTALQAEITQAMARQDFASVVKLSQDLLTLQHTVEIRKPLTE